MHLINLFLHQSLAILGVLGCVIKLFITAFRDIFYHFNVASIWLAIQFRVLTYNTTSEYIY